MPNLYVPIEEQRRSVLSPIIHCVISDLKRMLGIPEVKFTVVSRNTDYTKTDNRSNLHVTTTPNIPRTVADRRLLVSVEDDFDEEFVSTTAVHRAEYPPIFSDTDVSVVITPIYVRTKIALTLSYITPSESEAERIRNEMRVRVSQHRTQLVHEPSYSLIIPSQVEDFILTVFSMKNRLQAMDMEGYIRSHSPRKLYPITDMSGAANARLAINETQLEVFGSFENILPEKIEVDQENNNFKVNVRYNLPMDIPTAFSIRFPIACCNQLFPDRFIQFQISDKPNSIDNFERPTVKSQTLYALHRLQSHQQLTVFNYRTRPINIPYLDDYVPKSRHPGYTHAYSFLISVDETDRRTLLDLNDLGDVSFDPVLLEFIRTTERNYCTVPNRSFMFFALHQEGSYFDADRLIIDENLIVKSAVPLDLHQPVRVTIGLLNSLTGLDRTAIERYIANPDILIRMVTEVVNNNSATGLKRPTIIEEDTLTSRIIITTLIRLHDLEDAYNTLRLLLSVRQSTLVYNYVLSHLYNNAYSVYTELRELNMFVLVEIFINISFYQLLRQDNPIRVLLETEPGTGRITVNPTAANEVFGTGLVIPTNFDRERERVVPADEVIHLLNKQIGLFGRSMMTVMESTVTALVRDK